MCEWESEEIIKKNHGMCLDIENDTILSLVMLSWIFWWSSTRHNNSPIIDSNLLFVFVFVEHQMMENFFFFCFQLQLTDWYTICARSFSFNCLPAIFNLSIKKSVKIPSLIKSHGAGSNSKKMASTGEIWIQWFSCCFQPEQSPRRRHQRHHQRLRIDRSMIGNPTNFVHTGKINKINYLMLNEILKFNY